MNDSIPKIDTDAYEASLWQIEFAEKNWNFN